MHLPVTFREAGRVEVVCDEVPVAGMSKHRHRQRYKLEVLCRYIPPYNTTRRVGRIKDTTTFEHKYYRNRVAGEHITVFTISPLR